MRLHELTTALSKMFSISLNDGANLIASANLRFSLPPVAAATAVLYAGRPADCMQTTAGEWQKLFTHTPSLEGAELTGKQLVQSSVSCHHSRPVEK